MKLSVIIPTKNEERHMPSLLKQIASQTLQPLEVIVADADSEDQTVKIAKEAGAKVVKGGMPGVGRNKGAAVAAGDVFLFLDADVTLPSDTFLHDITEQFNERGLDMASTTLIPVDGTLWDGVMHKVFNGYMRFMSRVKPHAAGAFMLVRANIHRQLHGFDESITFAEDTDYAIRAAKVGRFGILRKLPILASTRRMRKEGGITIAWKYLFAELHILFIGPIRHDFLRYNFDYSKLYGRKK